MIKLYIKVTMDEYELPLCVEFSAKALAEKIGVKPETIWCSLSQKRPGYLKIEVDIDMSEAADIFW